VILPEPDACLEDPGRFSDLPGYWPKTIIFPKLQVKAWQDTLECVVISPQTKVLVDRSRAEALGQIQPSGTGTEDPGDAFKQLTVIAPWTSTPSRLARLNDIID
jgi:hypothetical protein